jgi:hypothetical protein
LAWKSLLYLSVSVTKSYKSLTRAKIQNFKTKPSFLAGLLPDLHTATGGKGCVRVPNRKGLQVRTPSSLAVVEISNYSSSVAAMRTFLVARKHRQFRRFGNKSDCFGPLPLPRTQCHENYAQPCSRNKIEFYLGFWGRQLGMDSDRQGSQSSESPHRSGGLRVTTVRCLGMRAGIWICEPCC